MGILGGLTRAAHALVDHTGITGVGGGGDQITDGFGEVVVASSGVVYLEPDTGKAVVNDTGDGIAFNDSSSNPSTLADTQLAQVYYNSATHELRVGREISFGDPDWLGLGSQGWAPKAYSLHHVPNGDYTTAITLPANGGSILVPVRVPAPMKLTTFSFYGTDTTGPRDWECALYYDANGSASATMIQGTESNNFTNSTTVSAAGVRNASYATGTPIWLPAGILWAVIRNTHATNTMGVGSIAAAGSFSAYNSHAVKTLGSFLGAAQTLDLVTSWTKATGIPGVMLQGRSLNQSTTF